MKPATKAAVWDRGHSSPFEIEPLIPPSILLFFQLSYLHLKQVERVKNGAR